MSQQPIDRSPDLRRLRDEGYDVQVLSGYLMVRHVPYVTASGQVKLGILVSELSLADDTTKCPATHVMEFAGEYPCHKDGSPIEQIRHGSARRQLAEGLEVDHSFSSKPASGGYADYYEKVTTYAAILSSPAQAIDASVTAKCFPAVEAVEEGSVFTYVDTASSRAGITMPMNKLKVGSVGIVGLGGTGAYVLDLVAKTPVASISIFDGDRFLQHNAFRAPGAPSLEELRAAPLKVEYYQRVYGKMHRGIVPHACYVTADNTDVLRGLNFVFLCMDSGPTKRSIIVKLEELGVCFIDVGMGVELAGSSGRR